MIVKVYKKLLLIPCLAGVGLLQAQESIHSGGGDASGSGGSAAYSIGQVVYTTQIHTSGTVSQGVQQPYDIFSVGMDQNNNDIAIAIFPNPALHDLTLQITEYNQEEFSYQFFDLQGRLLNQGQITSLLTHIPTGDFPPAIYFVKVLQSDQTTIETFKIIKN